jgi:glycosyltransferase involved in cell wall biosynthesis
MQSPPRVLLLGPALTAVSGVSTHLNVILTSDLQRHFTLAHFQVGSEGRQETRLQKLWRFVTSPLQLAIVVVKARMSIVHVNTALNQKAFWRDLAYLCVTKLLRRRVLTQVHGELHPQEFAADSIVLTWLVRQFLVRSDAVTILSRADLAAFRAFDDRIKVYLVPNAIDPTGLLDEPRSFNRTQPLRLVFMGRMVATKGIFEMVNALHRLKQQGRQFTLSIVGNGPEEAQLRQLVADCGLDDRIEFQGGVFGAAKQRLWLDSDVFLFPTYTEGLPYALLEAMAAGCVPVTTPVGAIPDVMDTNVHGLLVPAKEPSRLAAAIAQLDDDRAALVRMAEESRRRIAEGYTCKRLAAAFGAVYRELSAW